jgi:hypothetical protein
MTLQSIIFPSRKNASSVKLQSVYIQVYEIMAFSIIKQIVHVVEGKKKNIENFHPSKNHCQHWLTPRLTMIFSG